MFMFFMFFVSGRVEFRPMGSEVAKATAFLKACFAKFEFLVYISVNRIVMLGNEYFDNLGRYCFKKYNISDLFQSIGGD